MIGPGRKHNEWVRERAKLIKEAVLDGIIKIVEGKIVGNCLDCGHYHNLTPDHKKKRSQGGKHTKSNIDWICNEPPCYCHHKRDNQGDPMKKKVRSKRASWSQNHVCKSCKMNTSFYLCHNCGKPSQ